MVLTNSTSITGAREEVLEYVFYVQYLVQFQKSANKTQVQALINPKSEVNAIYPTFIKELNLLIRPTNVGAQKIDNITLDTYRIVVAAFLVTDKANWVKFFKEIFLITNASREVVLKYFSLLWAVQTLIS